MHQDQRVGLALGVLLVGACAAFFFRNETRTAPRVPTLQHAQELDDRIAERSMRPYLKGIEAVETADRRRSPSSTTTADPAHSDEDQDGAFSSPRGTFDENVAITKLPRFQRPGHRTPDNSSEIQELAPIAIPNDLATSGQLTQGSDATLVPPEAVSSAQPAKPEEMTSTSATAKGRTHVVIKGETLSSIAAKTLGSPNRFQEIFEANQDQLSNPNDLKLGMTLQIPEVGIESASRPNANRARSSKEKEAANVDLPPVPIGSIDDSSSPVFESNPVTPKNSSQDVHTILMPPELPGEIPVGRAAEPASTEDSTSNPKFVPVRRTPLPGRPAEPQTKTNRPRETSGRRLSQASLESTSGKVAR